MLTAALTYLSQLFFGRLTDELFERHMRRAAVQISARQHFFPHH